MSTQSTWGPQANCSFIQQDHSHQQHLNHLTTTHISITMATLHYLPPVKPSAIALGVVFNQVASVGVLALCSVTPTNAPRPPTARKSSSRARKLPPRLRAGVHPLLVQPFKHTVLLPSSMPPVPSATRDPPT